MPCPWCRASAGSLVVYVKFIGDQFGQASLAGHTLKTTARYTPVLTCLVCDRSQVGQWDDEQHAVFTTTEGTADDQRDATQP